MSDSNTEAFASLFKEAYLKCFGSSLADVMSETESKNLSNNIFEITGLVIGPKSLKNYSFYIIDRSDARHENPSVATLDTLARYVLDAPFSSETERKKKEAHFPYWYKYKNSLSRPIEIQKEGNEPSARDSSGRKKKKWLLLGLLAFALIVAVIFLMRFFAGNTQESFTDDFSSVREDSLKRKGWFIQQKEEPWWSKRILAPGHLTLFTLRGDSWPDSLNAPVVKNLVLRALPYECFTMELQLDNFIPESRWQQAGVLLLEDSMISAKSLRLSISYNDYFGGYEKPAEILVQAVKSGDIDPSHPEEILHYPVFSVEPANKAILTDNFQRSALKIEKQGNHYRFLFAVGPVQNFAFKEILNKELQIRPKYIGLFALQGFVDNGSPMPAQFKFFSIRKISCE